MERLIHLNSGQSQALSPWYEHWTTTRPSSPLGSYMPSFPSSPGSGSTAGREGIRHETGLKIQKDAKLADQAAEVKFLSTETQSTQKPDVGSVVAVISGGGSASEPRRPRFLSQPYLEWPPVP